MKRNIVGPTVSVVMATYNGEKYIREQIDSILNQSYPIYELIIQDDCSTDLTPNICREYEHKYSNIHFYANRQNLGFNENFRNAVLRAKGDYVALSDQDDLWFTHKIEKQIATIGQHDICASWLMRGKTESSAKVVFYSGNSFSLLFRTPLGHTMLLKRDFAQDKSNWQSGSPYYDWSLSLNATLQKGIILVNEPLNFHRWHPKSFSCSLQINGLNTNNPSKTNPITPYIKGFKRFRQIQNNKKFRQFYNWIFSQTEGKDDFKQVNTLSRLMLKQGFIAILKLCLLCLYHRKDILEPDKCKGIGGILKGFFHPAIYFFWTDFFD